MKMKSGKKKRFDYYAAFEKQADIAASEARLLLQVVDTFSKAEDIEKHLPEAHQLESEGDSVCHKIYDMVVLDLLPPLDREDIISLGASLDSLTDKIEEIIQRFYMYDIHFMHHDAKPFAEMIVKSCDALCLVMKHFNGCNKPKKVKQLVIQVNDIENEADELFMKVIRKLHTVDKENPMRVVVWTSIFSVMEDSVDICETIADKINSIMIKNG